MVSTSAQVGESFYIYGGVGGQGIFSEEYFGVVCIDGRNFTKKASLMFQRYWSHACATLGGAIITGGEYSLKKCEEYSPEKDSSREIADLI